MLTLPLEAVGRLAASLIINGQREGTMHVKVIDGTAIRFPYTVDDLKADNPGTSFPDVVSGETLSEFGMFDVTIEASPACNAMTQACIYDDMPHMASGQWVLGCNVVDKPEAEAADAVRSERNRILAGCDWVVLSSLEAGTQAPAHWIKYRQDLRDISSQAGFPYAVAWPSLEDPANTK